MPIVQFPRAGAAARCAASPAAYGSAMPAATRYLVCATQRSGSTLVCELLAQTGVAGKPNEYLLLWAEHAAEQDPVFWRLAVQRTLEMGSGANGVSGIKVMAKDFQAAVELMRRAPEVRELDDWQVAVRAFERPRVIRIRRRDRLRQAVSLYIAGATRVYHVAEGEHRDNALLGRALEARGRDYNVEVPFDFDAIRAKLDYIDAQERYWDRILRAVPTDELLEADYEDFVADQQGHVRRMLAHLGIEAPAELRLEAHMRRMANEVNDRFVDEYRRLADERGR